jgi:hypothetical protein
MNSISHYLNGIHRQLGYRATWLPDDKLKLGDLGVFDRGRFVLRSNLAELNIKFTQRHGHGSELLSASAGSQLDSAGDARIAGASARIAFGRAGSFVFEASKTRSDAIADMARVGQEILFAFRAGAYRKNWVVIDRLVAAHTTTVLIAHSDSAEVVLGATAAIDSLLSLADSSLDLHVKSARGEVVRYLAATGLTPMFGASRLTASLWRDPEVEAMRGDGANVPPATLEDVTDDERFAAGTAMEAG